MNSSSTAVLHTMFPKLSTLSMFVVGVGVADAVEVAVVVAAVLAG